MFLLQRVSKLKENLRVAEKKNSDGKEINENINDRSVTKFASVEDPLSTCTELLQMRQLLFLKFQI